MALPYWRQTEVMRMRPYEELRIPSANVKKTPRVRIVLPRIYTHAYHTLSALVCTVKVDIFTKQKRRNISTIIGQIKEHRIHEKSTLKFCLDFKTSHERKGRGSVWPIRPRVDQCMPVGWIAGRNQSQGTGRCSRCGSSGMAPPSGTYSGLMGHKASVFPPWADKPAPCRLGRPYTPLRV